MKTNQAIYSIKGNIDASNAQQVQKDLLDFIINVSALNIILDFQAVDFIDSAGLMVLVAGYREAKNRNQDFHLIGVSPSVRLIFEVSQLDEILAIKDYLDADSCHRELIAA
jgi:anti-anti-sigma factor